MKLLLDTNVVIDYVGNRPPFCDAAKKVVAAAYFGDVQLWTSTQSIKDAYYVLSHYIDQRRVQRALRRFLDIVRPVTLPAEDALRGLHLEWDDYEDCLIALCASAVKADFLITRDSKDFERSLVPAVSPQEWLEHMAATTNVEYGSVDLA